MKKTATKGDKKKKKDVAEEIAKLETEIEAKHAAELKKFQVWLLIDKSSLYNKSCLRKKKNKMPDRATDPVPPVLTQAYHTHSYSKWRSE